MGPLTLSWLHSLSLLPDDERCHHGPRLGSSPRVKKEQSTHNLPPNFFSLEVYSRFPGFPFFLCCLLPSCGAITLWPGAQQQPSGNGLRLLRELPVHFAIDYRGWTPIPLPPPTQFPLCLRAYLSSPQSK